MVFPAILTAFQHEPTLSAFGCIVLNIYIYGLSGTGLTPGGLSILSGAGVAILSGTDLKILSGTDLMMQSGTELMMLSGTELSIKHKLWDSLKILSGTDIVILSSEKPDPLLKELMILS